MPLKSSSNSVNDSSNKSGQETKLYLGSCRKRKNDRPLLIRNPWISIISKCLFSTFSITYPHRQKTKLNLNGFDCWRNFLVARWLIRISLSIQFEQSEIVNPIQLRFTLFSLKLDAKLRELGLPAPLSCIKFSKLF